MFPFLNYIPERWAKWKSMVKDLKERQRKTHFALLVRQTNCKGRREWVMHGRSLEQAGGVGVVEGGSWTLVLFLVVYPKVQRKAQEVLDCVVGDQRAPTLEDFENLPYIQAIIEETHRICPVAAAGIPHATTSTGEEQLSSQLWNIHDPEIFQDPETFNPDRFLLTEQGTRPDVDDSGFKGRTANLRICPGVHLAHNSSALNTMNLLWAFNFRLAKDPETDKEWPVDMCGYEEGFALTPKLIKCRIIPRGEYVKDIVEREFHAATDTFVKYERDLAEEDSNHF
ncbi:cytochrome p450 [Moniliophthora roreri MCA 2997]|uniref:Cytochrome p450 n=1 Tax=Moniliophthora roreri (strain MCA 2997) TaxID=1381753 RepID=V2X3N9_MONRO|nr:cytochrome p450 [Moniliophthora roreri MCA 2997]